MTSSLRFSLLVVRNSSVTGTSIRNASQQQQQTLYRNSFFGSNNSTTPQLVYFCNNSSNSSKSSYNTNNNYNGFGVRSKSTTSLLPTNSWIDQKKQQQQRHCFTTGGAVPATPNTATSTTLARYLSSETSPPTSSSTSTTRTNGTNGTTVEKKRIPKSRQGNNNITVRIQAANAKYKKPTLDIADDMSLSIQEIDNKSLLIMAAMNSDTAAHVEMLKRHIMSINRCSYDDACIKFKEIQLSNIQYLWLIALPYRIGIVSGTTAAIISVPMVFYLPLADWFNRLFVTTSIPDQEDIETILEVGS
jgi:hypothetical protein